MNYITLYEKFSLRMDFCPETQAFSVWYLEKVLITTTKAELADAYFTKSDKARNDEKLISAL